MSATARNLDELWRNVAAGSLCTSFSVALWNPLDTLRIRWQVAGGAQGGGMAQFARDILRSEGLLRGLWVPGCLAHSSAVAISSGARLGFYPTLRDLMVEHTTADGEKRAWHMWSAGFLSGAVGFFSANPFFLAKVRLQATTGKPEPPYRGMLDCLSKVGRSEGISGLFRGSSTLLIRGALLSAGSQLGYDFTKTEAKRTGLLSDGPVLHVIASVFSAFLASTMSAPCDLVMTRYQAAPILGRHYAGLGDCVRQIYREGGVREFYRGWAPLFLRLAPLWMFNMPLYEACRRLFGLSYLN